MTRVLGMRLLWMSQTLATTSGIVEQTPPTIVSGDVEKPRMAICRASDLPGSWLGDAQRHPAHPGTPSAGESRRPFFVQTQRVGERTGDRGVWDPIASVQSPLVHRV